MSLYICIYIYIILHLNVSYYINRLIFISYTSIDLLVNSQDSMSTLSCFHRHLFGRKYVSRQLSSLDGRLWGWVTWLRNISYINVMKHAEKVQKIGHIRNKLKSSIAYSRTMYQFEYHRKFPMAKGKLMLQASSPQGLYERPASQHDGPTCRRPSGGRRQNPGSARR